MTPTKQTAFRAFAADGMALRATVIVTGPRGCYRCTRRAIGTATIEGRVEDACVNHATKFEGLAL